LTEGLLGDHTHGIAGIFNDRGEGKTTGVVKTGVMEQVTRTHYAKVYANIHIGAKVDPYTGLHFGWPYIDYVTFHEVSNWHFRSPRGIPRVLLLLDQVHKYLEPREAMTKKNRHVIKVIIESRQHGFDVLYDTWGRKRVDPAIRPFTQLVIDAHAIRRGQRLLGFRYDRYLREGGRLKTLTLPLSQAMPIFELFDSNEVVREYDYET
jgi:hypothetical protein